MNALALAKLLLVSLALLGLVRVFVTVFIGDSRREPGVVRLIQVGKRERN